MLRREEPSRREPAHMFLHNTGPVRLVGSRVFPYAGTGANTYTAYVIGTRSEGRRGSRMIRRWMHQLVVCVAAVICTQWAVAQEAPCQLYKVRSSTLNISKEPRGDAVYIDMLDNADVVCVTREQKVGEQARARHGSINCGAVLLDERLENGRAGRVLGYA